MLEHVHRSKRPTPRGRLAACLVIALGASAGLDAFEVQESGNNNVPPDQADSVRNVDTGFGATQTTGDLDWWFTLARPGDEIYVLFDAAASTSSTDTFLEVYTDLDLVTPIGTDDSSGPGLASAIAGLSVPAGAEQVFYSLREDGQDSLLEAYTLHHYTADPDRLQFESGASNDTPATADPIVVPLVSGTIDSASDIDYFAFDARQGDSIVVIMDDDPQTDGQLDTGIAIVDASDTALASGDDSSLNPANAAGPVAAPSDGTYYVRIQWGSIGNLGEYRFVVLVDGRPPVALGPLSESQGNTIDSSSTEAFKSQHSMQGQIQSAPDIDYARITGRIGDRVYAYVDTSLSTQSDDSELSLRDDADVIIETDDFAGPGSSSVIAGAILTSQLAYLRITEDNQDATIDRLNVYAAVVDAADVANEITPENNATLATADELTATRMRGLLTASDTDHWQFQARAGDNIAVIIDDDPDDAGGTTVDTDLEILDPLGNSLAFGDNNNGNNANAAGPVVAPVDGTYYARVQNGDTAVDEYEIVVLVTDGPVRFAAVAGMVSGLELSNSVTLSLDGEQSVIVSSNGAFSFPEPELVGSTYSVTVTQQPTSPSQTCSVTNGSGVVPEGGVSDVTVTCTVNTYSVGGQVSNLLAGNDMVLQINGSETLFVNGNGPFQFPTELPDGTPYVVEVIVQPDSPPQDCGTINGSGTVSGRDVTTVQVVCGLIFGDGFEG